MRKLLVAGLLIAATTVPTTASGARPGKVSCGQTVTQSIRLANDLADCPGDGLVIGRDGITVDLGGHTVDGSAAPDGFGIRDDGFSDVTVTGGTIQEFGRGVDVENAQRTTLHHLTVRSNVGRGILLVESSGGDLEHNVVTGNTRAAIGLVSSDDSIVNANRTSHNHVGVFATDSSGNEVAGNSFAYNDFTGIETDGVSNSTFAGNQIVHSAGGVVLVGDGNAVTGNQIADIPLSCNDDGCPIGLSVEGGSNNVVAENRISGGYIGLKLDDFVPPMTNTIFRDNVARGAALYGIGIDTEQAGPVGDAVLDGNVALESGDDGINVQSSSTTLTDNHAMNNADLGIESVAGVTDGGGNVAHANGNPLECTNVFCR